MKYTTEELYGFPPSMFNDMGYWEALTLRERESKSRYRELLLKKDKTEEECVFEHYLCKTWKRDLGLLDERDN